jgi:xanthine dehydrogenase accessory factor
MIASRRKAEKLRAVMRMRGIDESQLARLQAPAGSDAGAKTPGEIALVAIVAVLALLRGRHQIAATAGQIRQEASEGTGQDGSQPDLRTESGAVEMTGKFINPVCGTAVSTANPLHVEEHEGVCYYFCCDGCWTTFQKDPAKYAAIHQVSIGRIPA